MSPQPKRNFSTFQAPHRILLIFFERKALSSRKIQKRKKKHNQKTHEKKLYFASLIVFFCKTTSVCICFLTNEDRERTLWYFFNEKIISKISKERKKVSISLELITKTLVIIYDTYLNCMFLIFMLDDIHVEELRVFEGITCQFVFSCRLFL